MSQSTQNNFALDNGSITHGSLFSGIGGFDLAAEWMGWENVFHCEIDPFCQKVLKYYWPSATTYGDIKNTDFTIHRGLDILTGGFPCQPFSSAGKRKGTEDARHLWPWMLRAIREIQPRYVVGENVRGLTNWNGGLVFDQVLSDLEAEGYEVLPFLLPACAVNAPHRRDRVWIVAHATNERSNESIDGREESEQDNWSTIRDMSRTVSESGPTSNSEINGDRGGLRGLDGQDERQAGERPQGWIPKPSQSGEVRATAHRPGKRLQGGTVNGKPGGEWADGHELATGCLRPGWQDFPTQSPIHSGDDGLSRKLVRFVETEFYGTISETDRIQNVQEVWESLSSEDVWGKVRGLYSLERKDILLQTMQLYQAGGPGEVDLSPFSETFSGPIMQKLRKYGKFGCSPHGQELEKQRSKEFGDSLSFLPHEVALASRAFETQLRKFETWHRKESIKAYGNSVVPQVVFEIFKCL